MNTVMRDRQCRNGHRRTSDNVAYVSVRGKLTRWCTDCRDATNRKYEERRRHRGGSLRRSVVSNGHVQDARSVLGDITDPRVLELFHTVGVL